LSGVPKEPQRAAKAREYFARTDFHRILTAVWKKYVSLERFGGYVSVPKATRGECEVAEGLLGLSFRTGDSLRFSLKRFEKSLNDYFSCGIPELYEILTGGKLLTRTDLRKLKDESWHRLFAEVRDRLQASERELHPKALEWLARLEQEQSSGYRALRDGLRSSPARTADALYVAARAWNLLLAGTTAECRGHAAPLIRLPMLASLASGDPHALDRNQSAGRLLFQALMEDAGRVDRAPGGGEGGNAVEVVAEEGEGAVGAETAHPGSDASDSDNSDDSDDSDDSGNPDDSDDAGISGDSGNSDDADDSGNSGNSDDTDEKATFGIDSLAAREIYRQAGIADDDISSIVHLYDPLGSDSPTGQPRSPFVLTLRQIEAGACLPHESDLYLVENPSVFSTLADLTETVNPPMLPAAAPDTTVRPVPHRPILICTSGPASAAALRLIDRWAEARTEPGGLFYSGDYDIRGLEMGNVLASRYSRYFRHWNFDQQTYLRECGRGCGCGCGRSPESPLLSSAERERLSKLSALWDADLLGSMRANGSKLYQEQLLPKLADDWLGLFGGRS